VGVAVGYSAGSAASTDDFVFVGNETATGWFGNQATLIGASIVGATAAPVAVTITLPNVINYAAHGVPIGESRAYYITATTYPGGITGPSVIYVRALTANTLQIMRDTALTSVGAGVQVALYNGAWSNCVGPWISGGSDCEQSDSSSVTR
jgi:hypothetical protein